MHVSRSQVINYSKIVSSETDEHVLSRYSHSLSFGFIVITNILGGRSGKIGFDDRLRS